jgi:hypothetical protein
MAQRSGIVRNGQPARRRRRGSGAAFAAVRSPRAASKWCRAMAMAISHGATPDFYLDSCYVASQGQPSGWQTNFNNLMSTSAFANVRFGIAEYNNEAVTSPAGTTSIRNANDIIYNLANNRGFGAFFWEPTHSGAWGSGLFATSGKVSTAIASAFAIYDSVRTAYKSRL